MTGLVATLLLSYAAAGDEFDVRYQEATAFRIQVADAYRVQHAINQYCKLIADFPDHPQIYLADLAIIELLTGNIASDLEKANQLFDGLLNRHSSDSAAGQQIALRFLDFQLGICAGTEHFRQERCESVIELLLDCARTQNSRQLTLDTVTRQIRLRTGIGDAKSGIQLALEQLEQVPTWVQDGSMMELYRSDPESYGTICTSIDQIQALAASALDRCPDTECLELAKQIPQLSLEPGFLDAAIVASENQLQRRTELPQTLERQSPRYWLLAINGGIVAVILAWYVYTRFVRD